MDQHTVNWEHCLEHAALSDVGLRRANNQDAMAVVIASSREMWQQRGHLFLVADGMGAHAAGEHPCHGNTVYRFNPPEPMSVPRESPDALTCPPRPGGGSSISVHAVSHYSRSRRGRRPKGQVHWPRDSVRPTMEKQ